MNTQIHPVLKELLDFGCSDLRIAPTAFAVYMDLAEVKALWDLEYKFCKELDIIYITGKENATDTEGNTYIPLPASHSVSPEWILKVQNILTKSTMSLMLAFKDTDSTVVYYKISHGLVSPDSPEAIQNKKSMEETRRLMQAELWRKRNQIFATAEAANHEETHGQEKST